LHLFLLLLPAAVLPRGRVRPPCRPSVPCVCALPTRELTGRTRRTTWFYSITYSSLCARAMAKLELLLDVMGSGVVDA
jgi:hypothetical protein